MNEDFSVEKAIAAQRELRKQLGLPDERFGIPALIGMLSDEIEKLRAAGRSDGEITGAITRATGKSLSPDMVSRYYATPQQRHR